MLSCSPHLTNLEFDEACNCLVEKFARHGHTQNDWTAVEVMNQFDCKYLRVTKPLGRKTNAPISSKSDFELDELEEDDEEALNQPRESTPVINYDVLLSPTYQVPVLYIFISDLQHRFPPTMATLYEQLIPPTFKAQTEAVGVIGGITITDHPVTNKPNFFVHPCQTAEVMQASIGTRRITPEEYLIMWIGALGKWVGLDVPLALVRQPKDTE